MLEELLAVFDDPRLLRLSPRHQLAILRMAAEAVRSGGYTAGPVQCMEDNAVEACNGIVLQDQEKWYFPGIRSRARSQERQSRYNQKRRQTTEVSSNDGSVVDCTQSTSLINYSVNTQLRPAGACARNIDVLCGQEEASSNDGGGCPPSLFDCFYETLPEPVKQPVKRAVKPQPWHQLLDAIVKVTKADSRASTLSHAVKVAKDLHRCDAPYTADDVLALPAILERQPWWKASGGVLSIQVIQKHIGLVRAVQKAVASAEPDEYRSLDQLQREAVQSRARRQ